ncbi:MULTISPECIES: hypothetical protein [Burkholderia]|uniref:Replication protein n=1 Tax=Burkholderia pseudomultivorans TaxID=1207504 RepID=A0ABU2E9X4_9BURK|nr:MULTISPECIES: hypothetical protein [Burkholderia]MBR8428402.1 hypothetical protein [Burkholderia cenocepacia]MDN7669372.1 hypothetical protein [Burkholderia vietnamiensis]MDR8730529.1 hypothetical protein [Burkholderia pseudomultivorans]MDR8738446.1 hypothetical protein [Burkholderia pseudomultivorans]MDR8744859.1 hypothetical protein [Burkholderia pseudomultivorans]
MSAADYLNHFEDLWLRLKPFRPIAFGTRLARITGHPKDAMLLSQMVYWTRRGRDVGDNGGWIHKTREHWRIETGLSRDEQEGARARLRNLSLVSEWRGGRPACLHYRINVPLMSELIDGCCTFVRRLPMSIEAMREDESAARELLGPVVPFRRALADLTGSFNAGLVLSRMIQVQRQTADRQGIWFSLTAWEWNRTTGINRRQLDNAKRRLRQMGVLREVRYAGRGTRLWSQIDPVRLHALLDEYATRTARLSSARKLARAEEAPADGLPRLLDVERPVAPGNGAMRVASSPVESVIRGSAAIGISPTRIRQPGAARCALLPSAGLIRYRWRQTYDPNARAYTRITYSTTTTTGAITSGWLRLLGDARPDVGVGFPQVSDEDGAQPGAGVLVWPSVVSAAERGPVSQYLARIPAHDRQLLLDEMAAGHRRQAVRFPVAYIGELVRRYLAGEFVPARGHREAEARRRSGRHRRDTCPGDARVTPPEIARAHLASLRAQLGCGSTGVCHA